MTHLIDKDALVAEVKRRMDENRGKQSLPQYFGMVEEDLNILYFLDTLEVKESPTDAFIEKACKWLNIFYNEDTHSYLIDEDIKKFKNYMKGE